MDLDLLKLYRLLINLLDWGLAVLRSLVDDWLLGEGVHRLLRLVIRLVLIVLRSLSLIIWCCLLWRVVVPVVFGDLGVRLMMRIWTALFVIGLFSLDLVVSVLASVEIALIVRVLI